MPRTYAISVRLRVTSVDIYECWAYGVMEARQTETLLDLVQIPRFHGVMVSTRGLDPRDRSSILLGTSIPI